MKLKLIETNDTPKIGDLVKDWISGSLYIIKTKVDLHLAKEDKVVKPYGISDEEIKEGDWYITPDNEIGKRDSDANGIGNDDAEKMVYCYHLFKDCKKVNILPEQFNYEEIVDLWLKDGDEFKAEPLYSLGYPMELSYRIIPVYNYEDLTSTEIKPTPVTYTEEEVKYYLWEMLSKDFSSKEEFEEWFEMNKK
jgi:hypothetical protein